MFSCRLSHQSIPMVTSDSSSLVASTTAWRTLRRKPWTRCWALSQTGHPEATGHDGMLGTAASPDWVCLLGKPLKSTSVSLGFSKMMIFRPSQFMVISIGKMMINHWMLQKCFFFTLLQWWQGDKLIARVVESNLSRWHWGMWRTHCNIE
jgi:hypothetical protein